MILRAKDIRPIEEGGESGDESDYDSMPEVVQSSSDEEAVRCGREADSDSEDEQCFPCLDPIKLAGQCGKLKCCLNFELDQYVEAVKEFPSPHAKIQTQKGKAVVFKMDIFKKIVYFLQLGEHGGGPVALPVEDANRLIANSQKGEKIQSLTEFAIPEEAEEIDHTYSNVVGQDDLTRFDKSKGGKRRNKRNKKKGGRNKKKPVAAK